MNNAEPDLQLAALSLWVNSREFPNASDYWDANWLNIHARVQDTGAVVTIAGPWVRADELARFSDGLRALYRDLKGTAKLECLEPSLRIAVTCGARGDIDVIIDITPDQMTQSHRFKFSTDQTSLPPILADLQRLLERFPVRGAPSD